MNNEALDKFYMWLAWLLPRRLVMWAAVRLMAHATTNEWAKTNTSELLAVDALKRWDDRGVEQA